MSRPLKVLFVCMGNICRSPAAECIFRELVESKGIPDKFEIDSAGTIGFHQGSPPDRRMTQAALEKGIVLKGKSRPLKAEDLNKFDYIIGMDDENISGIQSLVNNPAQRDKIKLMCDYCTEHNDRFVPDPYYGGDSGFKYVIELLEDACQGFFDHLKSKGRI